MKNLDDLCVLTQPGRDGAGPEHWLSNWERSFPAFVRVEQTNWAHPIYAQWATRLSEYIASAPKPVLLIGHSLGTSLIMRWTFINRSWQLALLGHYLQHPRTAT